MCWIGFGEAGSTFALGAALPGSAYDLRDDASMRSAMADASVARADSIADSVQGTSLILSLVTADQALVAAQTAAFTHLNGALFCDMNSVAPDTKRSAAKVITAAGGRYIDVAVMAPVRQKARAVPLLVSGPDAQAATDALAQVGFTSIEVVGDTIGDASVIKMIRSVMVKGIEALSAECALAADAAGMLDRVIASLDASWPSANWGHRLDYNLDRMLIHGSRRAAEMDEVVKTLDALGTGSPMSRAVAQRQRGIGDRDLGSPPTLPAKLHLVRAA